MQLFHVFSSLAFFAGQVYTTSTHDLASAVKTAKFLYDSLSEAQIQQNYVFVQCPGGGEYYPNTPGNFNYGNGFGIIGNGNLNFKGVGNALNISACFGNGNKN